MAAVAARDEESALLAAMDMLNLDEEVVDDKVRSLMSKPNPTNKRLEAMVTLLRYKHMLCVQEGTDCENGEEFEFVARNIFNEDLNVDLLCRLLYFTLLLNKETLQGKAEHFLHQIVSELNFDLNSVLSGLPEEVKCKIVTRIKVMDVVLDACIINDCAVTLLFVDSAMENILFANIDEVNVKLLQSVFPKMVNVIAGYDIIQRVINKLDERFSNDFHKFTFVDFTIMSAILDYILPIRGQNTECGLKYSFVSRSTFWSFIYDHFHNNSLHKKFVIYFAKRAIHSVASFKLTVNTDRFVWNPANEKALSKAWENFFVLVELLDEKQSHIVLSALPLLNNITELQPHWFECALGMALDHDNYFIKRSVLQYGFNLTLDNSNRDTIMTRLMRAANNPAMFQDFVILPQMRSFLNQPHNIESFLVNANPEEFSSIPSFFVSYAISDILRDLSTRVSIREIYEWNAKKYSNNIYLREAAKFCLLQSLTTLDSEIIDLQTAYDIIRLYPSSVMFHRGTILWNSVAEWISSNYTSADSMKLAMTAIHISPPEPANAARFFTMVLDVNTEKIAIFADYILNMLNLIESVGNREYANLSEIDKNYKFVIAFLSELCPDYDENDDENDGQRHVIFTKIALQIPALFGYICKQMKTFTETTDISIIDDYVRSAKILLRLNRMPAHVVLEKRHSLTKLTEMVLKSERISTEKYFLLRMLAAFAAHLPFDISLTDERKGSEVSFIMDAILDPPQLKGRLATGIIEACAEISYYYFKLVPMCNQDLANILYNNALTHVETGGYRCLPWVMKLTEELIPYILSNDSEWSSQIKEFLQFCWSETKQLRKHESFKLCVQFFIQNILLEVLLRHGDFENEIVHYVAEIFILGENSNVGPYELINYIHKDKVPVTHDIIISIVVDCLLQGQTLRKDQKIELETCIFVKNRPLLKTALESLNYHINVQHSIRLTAYRVIIENNNVLFYKELSRRIRGKIDEAFGSKQLYHENSSLHRLLLRGLQALLFLLLLQPQSPETVFTMTWCITHFSKLPHQPSAKLMMEWYIAVCVILRNIRLAPEETECLKSLPVISQMKIKYHVIKFYISKVCASSNKDRENPDFEKVVHDDLAQTLEEFLPYTMGQNFDIRLHAQYLFTKLMNLNPGCLSIKKYKLMHQVVKQTLDQNGSEKGLRRLQEDFYVNAFDIIRNLTPRSILYDVPRLTGVTPDEIVEQAEVPSLKLCTDSVVGARLTSLEGGVEMNAIHSCLLNRQMLNDNLNRFADANTSDVINTASLDAVNAIIQKKFVPWNEMLSEPNVDKSFGLSKKSASKSELVIVASLIDRPPNLGGLARTCEVLGVAKYIVSDLQVIKDKEFNSLSVTAEKWIKMEEVKPGDALKKYLSSMRENGYTIICAEQTTSSVLLNTFKFPFKTVVVLGSEREGIPCDLFPFMDTCIEIPQKGLVRSLNVHVSGALFIWEYMKQHSVI